MKLAKRIFRDGEYYITSKFGKRDVINTSGGTTSSFHSGVDYGTNSKKIPQYALEEGYVVSCGKDTKANGYALFVWVRYPRLGIKLLHYHLDQIYVKKDQKVNKNTILGTTGKTGKATGIHLHLGMKYLDKNEYVDPELYDYKEGFLHARGCWQQGDSHSNVGKISSFMYKTFPAYTSKGALGNLYGPKVKASIKEFQKRTGLKQTGKVDEKTLNKLKEYGFKY